MFHCLIIKDLFRSDSEQLVYYIRSSFLCQELFSFFWISFFRSRSLDRQLWQFIRSLCFCQELFSSFFEIPLEISNISCGCRSLLSSSNLIIISDCHRFVKNFFPFLFVFLLPSGSFSGPIYRCPADSFVRLSHPQGNVNCFFQFLTFFMGSDPIIK